MLRQLRTYDIQVVNFHFPRLNVYPLALLKRAGLWQGRILFEASGEHGFGYDPLFWVPERNVSSAELSPADKNQISHRARAMDLLRQRLSLK